MADFVSSLKSVLRGVPAYDPSTDKAYGLDLKFIRSFVYPSADSKYMQGMSAFQASTIYQEHFWEKASCGSFESDLVAKTLFWAAVEFGAGVSAMVLQRAVNAISSGRKLQVNFSVDRRTITAANEADSDSLVRAMHDQLAAYIAQSVSPVDQARAERLCAKLKETACPETSKTQ